MISIIDIVGYLPTYRKTYKDPDSERLYLWFIWSLIPIISILSLAQYNTLTLTYSIAIIFANLSVVFIILLGKRKNRLSAIDV